MEQKITTHREHFHGSDLEKIEKIYGIKKENITGFGANVNPLGLSGQLKEHLSKHLDCLTAYPDREYTSLRHCMGDYAGVPADSILVGNGSTELITLFISALAPGTALILGPSYSEYEREIGLAGGRIAYLNLRPEKQFAFCMEDFLAALTPDVNLFILCNPNNPTSTALNTETLTRVLSLCQERKVTVLVDETYVEFAPTVVDITAVPLTQTFDNLIVLRGTSKFFACPGLRLGYAITGNHALLKQVLAVKDPWTINSLAECAGQFLFSDRAYIERTRQLICAERQRICQRLRAIGDLQVYEPMANFVLVRILRPDITAQDVFDACIRQGMMIRDCADFHSLDESYFRFCFMLPKDNDRLLTCIESLFTKSGGAF